MNGSDAPVVVIGAGLAGLACAGRLHRAARRVLVLEGADRVGGRLRTERIEGFLVDRGFQVFLTAYPEARAVLDYTRLGLRAFVPGAQVWHDGALHRVADPLRRPTAALASLMAPIGTPADKLRTVAFAARARAGSIDELYTRPATTTRRTLEARGFSRRMIERFWRPFLGGITLDPSLGASSRMTEFVLRMMASGGTTLPDGGMAAIPAQLAEALPAGVVRLGARVTAVAAAGDGVTLEGGERIAAAAVVVATEGDAAAALLGGRLAPPAAYGETAFAYAAPAPPYEGAWLTLDGTGRGPVLNVAVQSNVQPSYAPAGSALVTAVVPGPGSRSAAELEREARAQLVAMFGARVEGWRLLRADRIRYGLPDHSPAALDPLERPARLAPRLLVAGDHRDTPSINGALASGRRAAAALLETAGP